MLYDNAFMSTSRTIAHLSANCANMLAFDYSFLIFSQVWLLDVRLSPHGSTTRAEYELARVSVMVGVSAG